MTDYKQIYLDYMDSKGIRYIDHDRYHVEVRYSGDNLKSIRVHVFFDRQGKDNVTLTCAEIFHYSSQDSIAWAIFVCNDLNKRYRWVKFYIDDDGDIRCEMDALIDPVFVGDECAKLVRKMVNIIDEARPFFEAVLEEVERM